METSKTTTGSSYSGAKFRSRKKFTGQSRFDQKDAKVAETESLRQSISKNERILNEAKQIIEREADNKFGNFDQRYKSQIEIKGNGNLSDGRSSLRNRYGKNTLSAV